MKFDLLFGPFGFCHGKPAGWQFGPGEDKLHPVWGGETYQWTSEQERNGAWISACAFEIVRDVSFTLVGVEKIVNNCRLVRTDLDQIVEVA